MWNARFAPDGQTIVYGASWNGQPIRLFLVRAESPESTPLGLPDAAALALSSSGELALSVGHRMEGWMGEGMLARSSILGGAPRAVLEHVREAEWTPDGSELAVVRRFGGRERLEFPIGKVLYETSGYMSHVRFSPKGDRLAFADHPIYADDNGDVAVVDLDGRKTTLSSNWVGLRGIAWSPDGREIWFTAFNPGSQGHSLRAVAMDRRARTLLSVPTQLTLHDVARDGRILMQTATPVRRIEALLAGETKPRDFSLFDISIAYAMSSNGRRLLVTHQGAGAGRAYVAYIRAADQPQPVRLGEGVAVDFSPDGTQALTIDYGPPSRLHLLSIGAGQSRTLPNPDGKTISLARWLPDGRVVFVGHVGAEPARGYVQSVADGSIRPFTPPGVSVLTASV